MTTTRPSEPATDAPALAPVADRWLALLCCLLIGTRISVFGGVTVGVVAAVLTLPLWLRDYLRGRTRILLLVLGVLALVWGYLLAGISGIDHTIVPRQQLADTAVLLQLIVGVGVFLWCVRVNDVTRACLAFGVGMVLQVAVGGGDDDGNPWKFFFAVPVAILLLGVTARLRNDLLDGAALLVLAGASAVLDSRSYAATFTIAALLKLYQLRPRSLSRRGSVGVALAIFAAFAGAVFWLGQTLLVAGYLGADAQQRSIRQIDQSGSLILGGRPELSATVALIGNDPAGHGVGVDASYHDVTVAKNALSSINYDPNNGYVDRFMFGNGIELHSVVGDLWARWGILGLVLTGLVAWIVVTRLVRRVVDRVAPGVVLFAATWTLWNLFFSPFYSALPTMIVCLGLLLHDPPVTGGTSAGPEGTQHEDDAGAAAAHGRPQRLR